MMKLGDVALALAAGALIWSAWAGWRTWTTPVRYQAIRWQAVSNGEMIEREGFEFRSFRQVSLLGPVPLLVPVGFAGLGTWAAWRRRPVVLGTSALLLALFTFVSGFSIGGAYVVPSAAMLLAMVVGLVDRGVASDREQRSGTERVG